MSVGPSSETKTKDRFGEKVSGLNNSLPGLNNTLILSGIDTCMNISS